MHIYIYIYLFTSYTFINTYISFTYVYIFHLHMFLYLMYICLYISYIYHTYIYIYIIHIYISYHIYKSYIYMSYIYISIDIYGIGDSHDYTHQKSPQEQHPEVVRRDKNDWSPEVVLMAPAMPAWNLEEIWSAWRSRWSGTMGMSHPFRKNDDNQTRRYNEWLGPQWLGIFCNVWLSRADQINGIHGCWKRQAFLVSSQF
jgi:hypothetical protein